MSLLIMGHVWYGTSDTNPEHNPDHPRFDPCPAASAHHRRVSRTDPRSVRRMKESRRPDVQKCCRTGPKSSGNKEKNCENLY